MLDRPPQRTSESRWVVASIEVQTAHLAWDLRLCVPHAAALALESARSELPADHVSEELTATAVGDLLTEFAADSAAALVQHGLSIELLDARTTVTGAVGPRVGVTDATGVRRWLLTSGEDVLVAELVPLRGQG